MLKGLIYKNPFQTLHYINIFFFNIVTSITSGPHIHNYLHNWGFPYCLFAKNLEFGKYVYDSLLGQMHMIYHP